MINSLIRDWINELRMKHHNKDLNDDDVVEVLNNLLELEPISANTSKRAENYSKELNYFKGNLDVLSEENIEKLHDILSREENSYSTSIFFNYINQIKAIYKYADDKEKFNLIEFAMRNPEVLPDHNLSGLQLVGSESDFKAIEDKVRGKLWNFDWFELEYLY